ncbi:IclR family transcriptional regulator [Pigmentiphaga sp. GD03639]|uniref:IclR family transcriptional regulator n=1 Tax=unclassified Pigmentiphaga TaxID=2626614 RepID=UPI000B40D8F5|nr:MULTISPECIES: IclR family transcriptional regulator [unclassified Pigmentiphaga]MDH2239452.1 IclR family transcriptional regulator [Pigmentiphaga sp. GD03639]OVZ60463.1 IclR family transcriptional regulator [Pigmentiphaga sp. NML030171]
MNAPHPDRETGEPALLTVARGLQVLRAFRSDRQALSNAELVRRTGLPKATVSRLTSTLLQTGFLRQSPGRRTFELGPMPLGIGHAYVSSSELIGLANPLLQDLADRLDVSVALAARDQLDMLYLGYRASHKVATLRMGLGSLLPMGRTAIGHAYLWGLPARQRASLVRALQKQAADPARLKARIHASFTELDATGTCAVLGDYQRDAYAVALPVAIGRRRILLALSCGKVLLRPRAAEAERRRIAPALIEAAARLEKLLRGFDGEP